MQIKLIFTTKVWQLASFWKWEPLELGNGLLKQKKKWVFFFNFLQTVIYICLHSHSCTHHTCSLILSMAQVSFSFVSNSLLYNRHTTWPPNKGKYNLSHNIHNKKQLILPASVLLIDLKSQIFQRKINFSGNCEPKIFLQQYEVKNLLLCQLRNKSHQSISKQAW